MIWFACSRCGKKHGRPDSSIGSYIFCDCGQGNTVPWESTVEAPEVVAEPVEAPLPPPLPPVLPRMEPIPVSEEQIPVVRRPASREGRERRRERRPVRDPNRCLNHQDLPAETICVGCEERFCKHCVVTFQGKVYCGPCKNKEIRTLVRPPRPSYLAIFSPVLALFGYLGFFLLLIPGMRFSDLLACAGFIILFQVGAIGLGLLSMFKMERDPFLTGKSLAVTGIVAAGIAILLAGVASTHGAMPGV
jgi:hypothetical protein